ncbi:hypothetical protein CHS0354_034934 [Potamilus streckersoni]|uniref:Uncharacterized protein n=1 Tax=Potamilus streckersoni TaxID=2493646 RepID=A0AAE0VTD8_9BIVA|nr:hypothetical protein CHS0354_034934 [Potamilus streckersoni]
MEITRERTQLLLDTFWAFLEWESCQFHSNRKGSYPTVIPDTVIPDIVIPDTVISDTVIPDTVIPDTDNPDTVIPDTGMQYWIQECPHLIQTYIHV